MCIRDRFTHTPLAQACVPAHARPQAPQFRASLSVSTHARPHSVCPVGHVDVHREATHAAVPPVGGAQAVPHAPQFAVLVRVSVSHPLAALPSQLA